MSEVQTPKTRRKKPLMRYTPDMRLKIGREYANAPKSQKAAIRAKYNLSGSAIAHYAQMWRASVEVKADITSSKDTTARLVPSSHPLGASSYELEFRVLQLLELVADKVLEPTDAVAPIIRAVKKG